MSIHQGETDSDDEDELDAGTVSLVEDYLAHDPRYSRRAHTVRSIRLPSTSFADLKAFLVRNPPGVYYAISDAGADATIVGDGWYIDTYMSHRKANVVGFDEKVARKNGLPIVCAYTTVVLPDGRRILLRAHEVVYNKGSQFTLLSEFQCRDFGCIVDSVSRRHRLSDSAHGTQSFQPPDLDVPIPFELRGCLMAFQHFLPTRNDMEKLTPVDITSSIPWDPNEHYESPMVIPALHTAVDPSSSSNSPSLYSCHPEFEVPPPMPLPFAPPFDIVLTNPVLLSTPPDPPTGVPIELPLPAAPQLPVTVDDVLSTYNDSTFSIDHDDIALHDHPSPTAPPAPDPPYHFDPTDNSRPTLGRAFDFSTFVREPDVDQLFVDMDDDDLFGRKVSRSIVDVDFLGRPLVDSFGLPVPSRRAHPAMTTPLVGPFSHAELPVGTSSVPPSPHLGGILPESTEPILVTHSPQVEPQRYTRSYLQEISKYLGYRPPEVVLHTLNNTTQLGTTSFITFPMRRHLKP
jgi:hypothetical protein